MYKECAIKRPSLRGRVKFSELTDEERMIYWKSLKTLSEEVATDGETNGCESARDSGGAS